MRACRLTDQVRFQPDRVGENWPDEGQPRWVGEVGEPSGVASRTDGAFSALFAAKAPRPLVAAEIHRFLTQRG
jgi:hypothetical protein